MVTHQLSYAKINLLNDYIVEVIIDEGAEISMEMLDECDDFIKQHLPKKFAVLVNRVNTYNYTFEAKFAVASHDALCAIAVVFYNDKAKKDIDELMAMRKIDGLNLKAFSGLELGWQDGYNWLEQ